LQTRISPVQEALLNQRRRHFADSNHCRPPQPSAESIAQSPTIAGPHQPSAESIADGTTIAD